MRRARYVETVLSPMGSSYWSSYATIRSCEVNHPAGNLRSTSIPTLSNFDMSSGFGAVSVELGVPISCRMSISLRTLSWLKEPSRVTVTFSPGTSVISILTFFFIGGLSWASLFHCSHFKTLTGERVNLLVCEWLP